MKHQVERKKLVEANRELLSIGLNQGSSGNLSVRVEHGFLITPSALPPRQTYQADIVLVDLQGQASGRRKPSSEWRFHREIYARRQDIQAVVHTHAPWCTTLACLGFELPAFHYMIALAGGNNIRCAPYSRFGSQQLSDHVLEALVDRNACLLANHGMVVTAESTSQALALAVEVENLARIYVQALQTGQPQLLSDEEMEEVKSQFNQYRISNE